MSTVVLGIRHHGPGSARAVRDALGELEPDAVLIEGPPEAEPLIELATDPAMEPPVALLVYDRAMPTRASFYPFAEFSPEWVALRYAAAAGVPVRFIDLPAACSLAAQSAEREEHVEDQTLDPPVDDEAGGDLDLDGQGEPARHDPIGVLAHAAGHDDPERWWEDVVEHQFTSGLERFAAVGEAMATLREHAEPELTEHEARREAAMRRAIRQAERDGHERIAVICGAWHAPVLERSTFPPARHDDALLRSLPKVKTAATWIPWTNDRLALHSGYGAGVTSPGWYHHLFTATDSPIPRWLQRVAVVLRDEGLDASPASVVEAVRLAETLSVVRGRPLPGLSEVDDATLAVLCQGNELALALVRRRLAVGDVLGGVPEATPMIPLMEDLARLQRSLRLRPEASTQSRDLDLRKDLDLARSQLLHRLALLGVPWGQTQAPQGRTGGTFKETWQLTWQPEFALRLIESARYGATIEAAAIGVVAEQAGESTHLPELTALVEAALLAGLPGAVTGLMATIADRAATDADLGRLMDAVEPLARVQRYGTVRRDDLTATRSVLDGLIARICVGLLASARGLDDEAASVMVTRIEAVERALALLDDDAHRADWAAALAALGRGSGVHPQITGRVTRLLLDGDHLDADEARRRMQLALSSVAEAADGAAWLEGFLAGSGLVLLHDEALLRLIDGWVDTVPETRFADLLPVLRRAFSAYPSGELRQLGQAVRQLSGDAAGPLGQANSSDRSASLDVDRAEAALSTVLELLG